MRIDNPSFVGAEAAITGSFTGSFIGDGSGLTGIQATLNTGSFLVTASINTNTLTFTKGNAETFNITVDTGSGVSSYNLLSDIPVGIVSSSTQIDLSQATGVAANAVSASYALSASHETTFELSSSHADVADSVPFTGITGKPTLVSGSSQISYNALSDIPAGIVSSSVLSSPSQGNVVLTTNGVAATQVDLGVQTSDHVQFHCIGVGVAASTVLGEIRAVGDITAYYSSDERLKENITPIEGGLNKIEQIQGYEFDWIPKEGVHSHEGHDIGVIAQEIEKIAPEAVTDRETGYKAVKYEKLVPILIQAINELSNKVKQLENATR